MNILEEYRKQLEIDKENEDYEFPEDSTLTEDQREEYVKELKKLRNDPNSIENVYKDVRASMKELKETDMEDLNIIKEEESTIKVKHAYCENCGEELISNAPPMFNPFTFERICKHTCEKCKTVYNLEYAYPRIVIYNKKGEEVPAFSR